MTHEIIIYSRAGYNSYTALARDLLTRYRIPFKEINITANPAAERLTAWAGEVDTPALVVAAPGAALPAGPPPRRDSPGPLICRPANYQLENWLHRYGFLPKPYTR
ncbi:MAG: glutaredoxin family protein [Anaerolineae bacterium]